MAVILFSLFTVALLWLFFRLWGLRKKSEKRAAGVLILQIIIFAWVYDGLILSLGSLLGNSDLLRSLSQVRLLLRMTFVPLLMVTALDFAVRGDVRWVQAKIVQIVVWVFAFLLVGFSAAIEWQLRDDMVWNEMMGVGQFVHPNGLPPLISVLSYLVIAIIGVLIWRKMKWVWVLLGGVIAVAGSLFLGIPIGPMIAFGAGVILVGCLVATERRLLTPDYSLSESELDSRISRVAAGRSKKSI